MTLEMGDGHQGICHIDLTGDGDCFEEGFINSNLDGIIPSKTICDQNGGIDDRLCEPILESSGQMGDRFTSSSGVEGVVANVGCPCGS